MHAVRTASRHPVCRIAFSPCGRWLAAAQPHHGVTLHDRATGAAVRTVGNPRRPDYTSIAFLPDGDRLAVCGSKGLELFDVSTGEQLVASSHQPFTQLSLGVVGGLLRGGHPTFGVINLDFTPVGDAVVYHPYWIDARVRFPRISPNGTWAVGFRESANPVAVDLRSRRVALALSHPARWNWGVGPRDFPVATFAAAAARVAVGDGTSIGVFDFDLTAGSDDADDVPVTLPVRTARFTLSPPAGWPAAKLWRPPFALTPDGRGLLVKRPRERVQLWGVYAGTQEAEWSWRLDGITCLAVAPDGLTAVAGGRFGRVLTWDLE